MNLSLRYNIAMVLLLIWVTSNVNSQNLVLNSGFEECDSAAIKDPYFDFRHYSFEHVKTWFNPTNATPDFYCTQSGYYTAQKQYMHDKLSPYAGNSYMGFISFMDIVTDPREYIGGQLLQPLENGKTYKFSLQIARYYDSNYMTDHLDVFFSNTQPREPTESVINKYTPQLIIDLRSHCQKVDIWEEVSGYYTATGGERFFILGNFKVKPGTVNDTTTTAPAGELIAVPHGTLVLRCYLFIDAVSLIAVDKDTLGIAPGKKLILNSINFTVNDSTLNPASYAVLNDIVASMKKQPLLKVEISGHTDNTGNPVSNQHLSEARARVVARYLISKGIDAKRITTKGYGSSKPVSTTDQNKNRRVEFVFSQ